MEREPAAVPAKQSVRTLSHDNRAHENLNGSDALEGLLALASCLEQTELVSQLVLRDGLRVVNLVSQNNERHLSQLLHGQ